MPFHTERPAGVMIGDIAAGDGQIGIVADLPGGRVGIALFGNPGQPRRIVYIDSQDCALVKRSWEWQGASALERATEEHFWRVQNRQTDRAR